MITLETLSSCPQVAHGFFNAAESGALKDLIFMNQVHSADVSVIDKVPETTPKVDALVTKTPGLKLAVKTADCAPVLFADAVHGVIGAAHAGWKGAFQGVLEATVLAMIGQGAVLKDICAGIGPHLQKESFAVSKEMLDLFPVTQHTFFEQTGERILFDFNAYVRHRLNAMGLKSVDGVRMDTYTDPMYFSYRRDSENPARQYSVISLCQKGCFF